MVADVGLRRAGRVDEVAGAELLDREHGDDLRAQRIGKQPQDRLVKRGGGSGHWVSSGHVRAGGIALPGTAPASAIGFTATIMPQ